MVIWVRDCFYALEKSRFTFVYYALKKRFFLHGLFILWLYITIMGFLFIFYYWFIYYELFFYRHVACPLFRDRWNGSDICLQRCGAPSVDWNATNDAAYYFRSTKRVERRHNLWWSNFSSRMSVIQMFDILFWVSLASAIVPELINVIFLM